VKSGSTSWNVKGSSKTSCKNVGQQNYEGRDFDVVVIDPNGLGSGQPSVGFGYRMAERYAGVSESTLRSWVRESDSSKYLELPSGKGFRVRDISASDGKYVALSGQSQKRLKSLQGLGFTEKMVRIISETTTGYREAETIDLRERLIRILCKRSRIPVLEETVSWCGRRKNRTTSTIC
jgi:hypothetical protein